MNVFKGKKTINITKCLHSTIYFFYISMLKSNEFKISTGKEIIRKKINLRSTKKQNRENSEHPSKNKVKNCLMLAHFKMLEPSKVSQVNFFFFLPKLLEKIILTPYEQF